MLFVGYLLLNLFLSSKCFSVYHMLFGKLNLHLLCFVHIFIIFGSVLTTPPHLESLSEFISMLFTLYFRSIRILSRRNLFNFFLAVSSFLVSRLFLTY